MRGSFSTISLLMLVAFRPGRIAAILSGSNPDEVEAACGCTASTSPKATLPSNAIEKRAILNTPAISLSVNPGAKNSAVARFCRV
jgi:hypothetical protein